MKKFFRWWPIGIICALWLAFSFPYWGKGLIPFPSRYLVTFFAPWSATHGMPVKNNAMPDVITQIYPWKRVTIDAWKRGELPLWNAYSFSGTSHIGNYQSAIFSPVNLLFWILPEIHAWSAMILLQPVLAGLFMYIFLRSLLVSREGSVFGSLAFMFCGFIVVWMAYGTLAYAVVYLPLIIFGINSFVSKGNTRMAVLSAIGLGLSFVSGHFQMSVYVVLYTASFLIYLFVTTKNKRRVWIAGITVIFGALLAAPQILPSLDAYANAVRSTIFSKGEVIPWQYLITLFSPDFYGNPVTRNDWFGHYAEWASFIGVAPLLVAVLAVFLRYRALWVRYFAVMTVIPVLFAFPTPLVDLLYSLRIPVLSTSAASRIIVLTSFSLAVLSGLGLDTIVKLWGAKAWKHTVVWSIVLLIFIAGVWATLLWLHPLPQEKLTVAIRNTLLPTVMLIVTLGIGILGFFLPKKLRTLLPYVLIVIASFDIFRFASKWMPFDEASYAFSELPVISKVKSLVASDHTRVFGNIGNEVGSAFGIGLIEGYDALYQYRYGKFLSSTSGAIGQIGRSAAIFDKKGTYSEDTLQFLGVRYYLHKKSDGRFVWAYPYWEYPHYRLVWEDDNFEILENTKSFPRVFLASSFQVINEDEALLRAFFTSGIDKRETLLLEAEPGIRPEVGKGDARITRYTPNNVTIETESDVAKLLFLSDVYDAGWRVTVDGVEASLLRAHYDFRAVSLRPGKHVVTMRYWPASLTVGIWISFFAMLCLGVITYRKRFV